MLIHDNHHQRNFSHVPFHLGGLTVETFLKKIGKECDEYVDKFESWEELFTMKSEMMKKREIPCVQRKWILHWVNRYRLGDTPGVDR